MSPERQVYLLDPQCLKPEVIAVAFAKTSRSPQSFREIAAELTDEKSAEFHEKWVVGFEISFPRETKPLGRVIGKAVDLWH